MSAIKDGGLDSNGFELLLDKGHVERQLQMINKSIPNCGPLQVITIDDDEFEDASEQLQDGSEDSGLSVSEDIILAYPEFEDYDCKSIDHPNTTSSKLMAHATAEQFKFEKPSPQRIMHLTDNLSSVITSSTTFSLPKNASKSLARSENYTLPTGRFGAGFSNYVMPTRIDKWNTKSNTAISSYRTKSSHSSSASTSSGCSSDCEHGVSSPDDEHSPLTHDTSPDSPDSGLSESVNSGDDLKHLDEEESDSKHDSPVERNSFQSSSFKLLNVDIYTSKFNDDSKECSKPDGDDSSCSIEQFILKQRKEVSDTRSIISQLQKSAQNNFNNNLSKIISKKQKFHCQWLDCDWPGSYEDLADHVREIHVELQPYLDSNGQVLTWSKHKNSLKSSRSSSKEKTEDDDASSNSCSEDDEDIDEDDADGDSDDDNQSLTESNFRVTRRTKSSSHCLSTESIRRSSRGTNQRPSDNQKPSHQQFVCLWRGCKVFGKPSSSRQWIERHVLEQHSGPKPFKCIVDSCGQRFKTQISLERHVNTHFRANNGLLPNGYSGSNYGNDPNSCCCKCSCHSSMSCDTTTISFQQSTTTTTSNSITRLTLRSDKTNRYPSTDSAISVNSISSLESLPGQSVTSAQSLSKPTSTTIPISDHCHSPCCCLTNKKSCDAIETFKPKVNKKRLQFAATPPIVKSITDFEYYDDYVCQVVNNRYRIRQNFLVKKRQHESAYKQVFVCKNKKLKTDNVYLEDIEFDKNGEYNTEEEVATCFDRQIVNVFDKRLFDALPDQFVFHSNIVATRFSSITGASVEIEWHPKGIFPNQIIKKEDYPKNKVRKAHLKEIPEQVRGILLNAVARASNLQAKSVNCNVKPAKKRKSI